MAAPEVLKVVSRPKTLVGEDDAAVRAEVYFEAKSALDTENPMIWRDSLDRIVKLAALGPKAGGRT